MIYNLNPVPVWKNKFDYNLSQVEKHVLFDCPLTHIQSNNNYFSRNNFILDLPELKNLKKSIQDVFINFRKEVLGIEQNLIITQSWVAKTNQGGWHSPHKHPNSMFSCVLYLQTSENSHINFHYDNELFKYLNLEFDNILNTEYNTNYHKIPVESLDIVIFPSWLIHSVDINASNLDRVVLGVNSFFFGEFGKKSLYPTKLNLQGPKNGI